MGWIIALAVVVYIIAALITVCHLFDDLDMDVGHAWLGGVIWPYLVYRGLRNGYLTNFVKKLDEAFTRD